MSAGISRDEWLKALHDAGVQAAEDDQSALTVYEFAAMMSVPLGTAAGQLRKLVALGRAKATSKWGVSSAGRRIQYRCYKLLAPEKKKR